MHWNVAGRFIREGESTSVIGVLKKQHAYDIVDAPAGTISTGCQPRRFMFPVLVEGLILIGSEDPDEAVYMVWSLNLDTDADAENSATHPILIFLVSFANGKRMFLLPLHLGLLITKKTALT
jgi:hypothetical protein